MSDKISTQIIISDDHVYKLKPSRNGVVLVRSSPRGLGRHWTILVHNERLTVHRTDEVTKERENLLAEDLSSSKFQQEIISAYLSIVRRIPNYRYLEKLGIRAVINPNSILQYFPPLFQEDTIDFQMLFSTAVATNPQHFEWQSPKAAWTATEDTVFFAVNQYLELVGVVLVAVQKTEGIVNRAVLFVMGDDLLRQFEKMQNKYARLLSDLIPEHPVD